MPLAQAVIPGCTLLDRYRVIRMVGEGGFGRVYEAERLIDQTRVALKIGRSSEHGGRMDREARLAALLKSPHSVRVFGVERLDNQSPMIVMELLEGMSLKEYLAMRGRVEPRVALEWALQLADALKEAHSIGLVHRDIKPSNLFLVESESGLLTLKLLDFGLARAPKSADELTVTRSDLLLGSPAYMSPEQIRGGDVSPQGDIWSLGVVLYEMLSGSRPFRAEHDAGLLAAITADVPAPLADLCSHLPLRMSRLVDRCLRKRASERPSDVRELADRLRRIQRSFDFAPAISWAESVDETTPLLRDDQPGRRGRRVGRWLGAVELCTLALGVAVWPFARAGGSAAVVSAKSGADEPALAEPAPRASDEPAHISSLISGAPAGADPVVTPRVLPSSAGSSRGHPRGPVAAPRRSPFPRARSAASLGKASAPGPSGSDLQPAEAAPVRSEGVFSEPDF